MVLWKSYMFPLLMTITLLQSHLTSFLHTITKINYWIYSILSAFSGFTVIINPRILIEHPDRWKVCKKKKSFNVFLGDKTFKPATEKFNGCLNDMHAYIYIYIYWQWFPVTEDKLLYYRTAGLPELRRGNVLFDHRRSAAKENAKFGNPLRINCNIPA